MSMEMEAVMSDGDDLGIFEFCGNKIQELNRNEEIENVSEDRIEQCKPKEPAPKVSVIKDRSNLYADVFTMPSADVAYDDQINRYADQYWGRSKTPSFNEMIVKEIWNKYFLESNFDPHKIFCLDLTEYLDKYIWPNYEWDEVPGHQRSDFEHVMSIVQIMNEKFRLADKDHWVILTENQRKFAGFITTVLRIAIEPYSSDSTQIQKSYFYRRAILIFLVNLFCHFENPVVKSEAGRLTRIGIWTHLSPQYRNSIFEKHEDLKGAWDAFSSRCTNQSVGFDSSEIKKKPGRLRKKMVSKSERKESSVCDIPTISEVKTLRLFLEKNFFFRYISVFIQIINSIPENDQDISNAISYCEKFIEFVTGLLLHLSTRRYLNPLLKYLHFYSRIRLSPMYAIKSSVERNQKNTSSGLASGVKSSETGNLFSDLYENLVECAYSYVDDLTGQPLYGSFMERNFYSRILMLQRIAFTEFPEKLHDLVVSNIYTLSRTEVLKNHISDLSDVELCIICSKIGLLATSNQIDGDISANDEKDFKVTVDMMIKSIILHHQLRNPSKKFIDKLAILPCENDLYGENSTPHAKKFNNSHSLLVPKITLQFLSMEDYLIRNLRLYSIESNFTIAQDINAIIYHLNPKSTMDTRFGRELTFFGGSSPLALPIDPPKITKINSEKLWERHPSSVYMDINLNMERTPPPFREPWVNLRTNEVMFLLSINLNNNTASYKNNKAVNCRVKNSQKLCTWCHPSLNYVRGCKFVSYSNDTLATGTTEQSTKDEDFSSRRNWYSEGIGANLKRIRVALDPYRYYNDMLNKNAPTEKDRQDSTDIADNNIYTRMNVIIRRRPQENNFESILSLLLEKLKNPQYTGPDWLYNIFLGHGNPLNLSYKNANNSDSVLHFGGVFQDINHVKECFSEHTLILGYKYANALDVSTQTESKGLPPRTVNKKKPNKKKKNCPDSAVPKTNSIQDHSHYEPPYILSIPKSYFPNFNELKSLNIEMQVTPGAKSSLIKLLEHKKPTDIRIECFANNGLNPQPLDYSNINIDDNSVIVHSLEKRSLTPLCDFIKPNIPNYAKNIRYTPKQIEGIISGLSKTLTLVLGPPGTGKTDVAVRIIASLYQNYPNERILLITHSNQALNQLFEKIFNIGIDPRCILRLGHGEEELQIEYNYRNSESEATKSKSTWGRYGRVNAFLEVRLDLLEKVSNLANSLDMPESHGSSCRTAGYFRTCCIVPKWDKFIKQLKNTVSTCSNKQDLSVSTIQQLFPFSKYFLSIAAKKVPEGTEDELKETLFPSTLSFIDAINTADEYYQHLEYMFSQLEQISAFEILTSQNERSKYLLIEQARIVAMVCTRASLKYNELSRFNFNYDSIVMEEASQILEVETFAPLFMQSPDNNTKTSKLKRIVMMGDHNQLPPVVKNRVLQRYANMEQSLFLRFIRLGVPTIQLNSQGRCRPTICDLFRWKYHNLKDLSCVTDNLLMKKANPGFAFEFQVIDVPLHNGRGEFQPRLHSVQNCQEAEYIASVYTYMILLGYPSDKIAILAAYNGQQELITYTLEKHRLKYKSYDFELPMPHQITTIDKFLGQQSDYVLISLTRTRIIGHLSDIRRLIVAISRARLGLYIFGFTQLLSKCLGIKELWSRLCSKPTDGLWVFSGEKYPNNTDDFSKLRDAECMVMNTSKNNNLQYEINPVFKDNVFKISNFEHMSAYIDQMLRERNEYVEAQVLKHPTATETNGVS